MNVRNIISSHSPSQNIDEMVFLIEGVWKTTSVKNAIEIGVHLGESMKVWIEAFSPEKIVGLERDTCYDYSQVNGTVLIGVDSHTTETKKLVCQEFEVNWSDPIEPFIDFLFIDGDHSYQGVKDDFQLYSPLVKNGGVIGFHDVNIQTNDTCEVYRFWNEIKSGYEYGEFVAPGGTGTGVLWV